MTVSSRVEAEQELVLGREGHLQVRLVEHVEQARHLARRDRAADREAVALLVGERDHHLGDVVAAGGHRDERDLVGRREVAVGHPREEVVLLGGRADRAAHRGDLLLEVEAAGGEVARALHEPVERGAELRRARSANTVCRKKRMRVSGQACSSSERR